MIRDLLLGLRLALGDRGSGPKVLRLALITVGLGLATAVLVGAVSLVHAVDAHSERFAGKLASKQVRPDIAPLYQSGIMSSFRLVRGTEVRVRWIAASGPNSPVPPGVSRVPAPGELVVSPGVARAFASPDGPSYRAQIPGAVIGEIAGPALVEPNDLEVYVGAPLEQLRADPDSEAVYGFSVRTDDHRRDFALRAVLAAAVAALLASLLIFVAAASRMGAAQRERRLAALRLLGLEIHRVRRVAAAESLIGAVAGLILGTALVLAARPLLAGVQFYGIRVSGADLVPAPVLAVLIALMIPVLAVGASIAGLRRTIIEPLGVARQAEPPRRRMWWRWAILGVGAVVMLLTLLAPVRSDLDAVLLALFAGNGLLLLGMAALLPWLVERLAHRLRGGPLSWELAVRRLRLDSGTPSRVVSGLVVVLAGAILIQVTIVSMNQRAYGDTRPATRAPGAVRVEADSRYADEIGRRLDASGVTERHTLTSTFVASGADSSRAWIGDCAALAVLASIGPCVDGDVFAIDRDPSGPYPEPELPSGEVRFDGYRNQSRDAGPTWTTLPVVQHISAARAARYESRELLITPAALHGVVVPTDRAQIYVNGSGTADDVADRVAVALAPLSWHVTVMPSGFRDRQGDSLARMRAVMLLISLFVLAVAGTSLLLHAIEQIAGQRRALAALTAGGVPVWVLVRVFFWQNMIPMAVGVLLAVATGIGLTVPTLRVADVPIVLDPTLIGVLVAAAVLACVAVTVLTIPLLRQATRLEDLRTE
ncbi:FtsX-like permease family protein [Nocardia sp. NPDC051570]|uniref:FtsX-like permease family protein n=1 Tax=Nocardia sp. NPDC051570 TaxID=3364324 RepID=UPI0037B8FE40